MSLGLFLFWRMIPDSKPRHLPPPATITLQPLELSTNQLTTYPVHTTAELSATPAHYLDEVVNQPRPLPMAELITTPAQCSD